MLDISESFSYISASVQDKEYENIVKSVRMKQALEREAAINAGRWIWSHHAPSAGARVCWSGQKFLRDPYLLDWINRFKPDLVLSGHIHNAPFYPEGSWIDRIGDTWVFNPGREPGPIPTHLNLDLHAMSAEWISPEGEFLRNWWWKLLGAKELEITLEGHIVGGFVFLKRLLAG